MAVMIALDAGTTGVRSLAVNESGRIIASSYREFTQYFPEPGWVEHDASEIWSVTLTTMAELMAEIDEPVVAIGITNQRETIVAWDRRTSEPLHRALVWQDRRTAGRCRQLEADGHLPLVRDTTGLVLDPYFSASKAEWLLTHAGVPSGPETALGTIDSWLVWNLTGGTSFVTDVTNASRTMLCNTATLTWSADLLDLFGVPEEALPEIRPSSGRLGTTAPDIPVGAGIPISGIAGDQQAALFGQACFAVGDTKNTYGTGSFVLMNVGPERPSAPDGLLSTVAWSLADPNGGPPTVAYALEGAIFVTGAAVQWLRDGLGLIDEAADLEPLARQCDTTGGVYLVPAFTGLGSPWWDPYARGTLVGLTRGSGRPEIARAVIEAMAFQTRDVVDAMVTTAGQPVASLRVDGGASVMDLMLQMQADQVGVEVSRSAQAETTAIGAAYLAGLAEGFWGTLEEIAGHWQRDASFSPATDRAAADATHAEWLRAVERSRHWAH